MEYEVIELRFLVHRLIAGLEFVKADHLMMNPHHEDLCKVCARIHQLIKNAKEELEK